MFTKHNLIKDTPILKLDLISCRNLLIYFKQEIQDKVISLFHHSLNFKGILFLGKSESIGKNSALFYEEDNKNKIYFNKAENSKIQNNNLLEKTKILKQDLEEKIINLPVQDSRKQLNEVLAENYAPPSLLINEKGTILEFFGDCSKLISFKRGKADFNLFSLIDQKLNSELRLATQKSLETKSNILSNSIPFSDKTFYKIAVHYHNDLKEQLVISFIESANEKATLIETNESVDAKGYIKDLEIQLQEKEKSFQSFIQEIDILKNEKQTLNEEFQTMNEELVTTNEELQAANEELVILNDEMNSRSKDLTALSGIFFNLMNSMNLALMILDNNLNILRFNENAKKFLSISNLIQNNLISAANLQEMGDMLIYCRDVLKFKKNIEYEFEGTDKKNYLIKYSPFLNKTSSEESLIGIVIVIIDITDKVNWFKEREAKFIIEEAYKAKTNFLATMSHEIRTPMNAIFGFSALLEGTVLNDEQKNFLKNISDSTVTLLTIINDILDFSKIESGKLDLEYISFSPRDVLKSSKELLKPLAQKKEIELVIEIDENIPNHLLGDPTRIKQVLTNLIGNAIKFTAKGKVTARLRLIGKNSELNKAEVIYEIIDTGIGIPKEKIELIFEPFSQVNSSTTRDYGGTGLGLSISKKFLELMHTNLYVESEVGKGSVFSFRLESNIVELETEKIITKPSFIENLNNLRILVAEDTEINQLLILQIFKKLGLKLDLSIDGTEAVEKAKQNQYDIIFLDIFMPEMDGIEAIQFIKRDSLNKTIPIIALTADVVNNAKERYLITGFDDYLSKPFKIEDLQNIIEKWCVVKE